MIGFIKQIFERGTLLTPNISDPESIELGQSNESQNTISAFMQIMSGRDTTQNAVLTTQQQFYIEYIRNEVNKYPMQLLKDIFSSTLRSPSGDIGSNEIFVFLKSIAESAQVGRGFNIDSALRHMVKESILCNDALELPLRNQALAIIFSCVGWICMLYPPLLSTPPQFEFINIDKSQCLCVSDSQPISTANRLLCEVIQDFGPLLPVRRESIVPNASDSVFSAESLYVSLLNASTLTQLGGIEVEWVTHISSHLEFDPETPKLFVFAYPSFCKVSENQSSPFGQIVRSYYDEYNMPTGFSSSAFLKEVRQSYRLLFSEDSRSCRHYKNHERKRLLQKGLLDPYLEELCGTHNTSRHQSSYSKATDFPIFAARLSIIQEYIQRQNPETISMLWKDRRNLLQWYTFWAVSIIGTLGILLSVIQTGLNAVQVHEISS
ncbi:hypothetical protein BGAL_0087g00140 [Botrytis galanthina]|uniref:Uncharacterized protein n=1 Tax=Botrytis galanthina TaxID=278940 RepID=A0A4S8RF87_9HELO|nr:hypothetical protein BGAL_0087g00140 [Botrytis galanthina]